MKYLMRFIVFSMLFIGLVNEPPRQSSAEDVNKQEQPAAKQVVEEPAKPIEPVAPQPVVQTPVVEQPPAVVPQPVPVAPVGCAHYMHLLSQYNWNVTVMAQVMKAESGCNPNAIGDQRVIGGIYAPSCGLFQVRTLSSRPSCEALQDPATNVLWAYKIYQGQGYSAWSVCKTKVRCY